MQTNDVVRNDCVESRLHGLADELVFPVTPDFKAATFSGLSPQRDDRRGAINIGVLLLIALALLLTPPARAAIEDALDVVGIEVRFGNHFPDDAGLGLLDPALFGSPVSLREAEIAVGTDLRLPSTGLPSTPHAVYLFKPQEPRQLLSVTFVYRSSDVLPAIPGSDIGAIFTQFLGPESEPYLIKHILPTSVAVLVDMEDGPAYWIEQGQLSATGHESQSRPSANVLVSLDDMRGYRFETMLDQTTAIKIAESVHPMNQWNQLLSPSVQGIRSKATQSGGRL